MEIKIKRLPHGEGLPLPAYQSAGAAGLDLVAAVPADAPLLLPPGGRALIPTGLALELPAGYEAQARPRSGLALHHGVTVLNAPGTIDSDYRGSMGTQENRLPGFAAIKRTERCRLSENFPANGKWNLRAVSRVGRDLGSVDKFLN